MLMDNRRPATPPCRPEDFEAAMRELAASVREVGESMLDLQQAVQALALVHQPALARALERQTQTCLRAAMRR
jgi:hypothetical protein